LEKILFWEICRLGLYSRERVRIRIIGIDLLFKEFEILKKF